jgi:hypothetical protein
VGDATPALDDPNYLRSVRVEVLAHLETIQAAKLPDGPPVVAIDPHHFEVAPLRGFRRVSVRLRGDLWRCKTDKDRTQDNPCSHILAVLLFTGAVQREDTSGTVWRKTDEPRNHGIEARAWEAVPARAPAILAKLLRQALPVIAPEPAPNPLGGQDRRPLYPQVYQAVMGTLFRKSLRCGRGEMRTGDHLAHNPWGPVSIATLSRFRADPARLEVMEKLLALSTWPARPYETLAHPDGTGLTEQHFGAYFDERYAKDRAKKERKKRKGRVDYLPTAPPDADELLAAVVEAERAAVAAAVAVEVESHAKRTQPREHHWSYAEMLWTYRYTLVAALHVARDQFGEAPWLIPLMERARLTLALREFGGDKAYDANYIFQYAKQHRMDAQVKVRKTPLPTYSNDTKRHRKGAMLESRVFDRRGYARRANRRNNAETGNHAFKSIVGDQIYSKGPVAQHNEVLCMALAYNLTRLVYLEVERGIEADFAEAVPRVMGKSWVPLGELYKRFKVKT